MKKNVKCILGGYKKKTLNVILWIILTSQYAINIYHNLDEQYVWFKRNLTFIFSFFFDKKLIFFSGLRNETKLPHTF